MKVRSKVTTVGGMALILMIGGNQAAEPLTRPAECANGDYRKQNYQACFGALESNDAAHKAELDKAELCKQRLAAGISLKTRIVDMENVEDFGRDEAWTKKYEDLNRQYESAGVTFSQHCSQLEEYKRP